MASGTPLLTTKLPCIPEEYDPYVYYILDETIDGMRKKISEILSIPKEKLHDKGWIAREFVLKKNNNYLQAKKNFDFIKKQIL